MTKNMALDLCCAYTGNMMSGKLIETKPKKKPWDTVNTIGRKNAKPTDSSITWLTFHWKWQQTCWRKCLRKMWSTVVWEFSQQRKRSKKSKKIRIPRPSYRSGLSSSFCRSHRFLRFSRDFFSVWQHLRDCFCTAWTDCIQGVKRRRWLGKGWR